MNTLNKGDIYLNEEELLLNDLSILDIVFIRETNETKSDHSVGLQIRLV